MILYTNSKQLSALIRLQLNFAVLCNIFMQRKPVTHSSINSITILTI